MWINTNEIFQKVMTIHKIRGSQFWKKISNINCEKKNGYAFEGDLLPLNRGVQDVDLKIGDLVLMYCDHGSTKYHAPEIAICEVTGYDVTESKMMLNVIVRKTGKDWAAQILSTRELVDLLKEKLKQDMSIEEKFKEVIVEFKNTHKVKDDELKVLLERILNKI